MLCKCDDGSEIKYKEDDFVNFKDFAKVIKNRNKRTIDNDYPTVKFISHELDSKIFMQRCFLICKKQNVKLMKKLKKEKL